MDAERPAQGASDDAVAEAAAAWLARCDRGLNTDEAAALRRWQAADPRHARALAELQESWDGFDLAKADPELAREAAELDRQTAAPSARRTSAVLAWLGAAAAIVVLAGVAAWRSSRVGTTALSPATNYQVLESVARRVQFADGSSAEVRGDSEVRADYTAAERRVHLVRGEAHFTVLKDPARPFVVVAGGAAVQAVGTAFNVRLEPGRVEVLVTQGTVQVAEGRAVAAAATAESPLVTVGERAVITARTPAVANSAVEIRATTPAEVDRELAWQTKRLVFDRTPLQEAIDAFNQHTSAQTGLTIVLGDDALRSRRLGGTFRAANAEAFVRLLEQTLEIRSERQEERIVLLPAGP